MTNAKLLELLCCPEDHSQLHSADGTLVQQINAAITARRLRNRGGRTLDEPIDDGLIRARGDLLYPIVRGIPLLLRDEAIAVNELQTGKN